MLLNDLYTIEQLKVEGSTVEATIRLNPKHSVFEGHFPGNPVVPGVCLMAMVKDVLAAGLQKPLQLSEAQSVKFLGVINPDESSVLSVHCDIVSNDGSTINTRSSIKDGDRVVYKAVAVYSVL